MNTTSQTTRFLAFCAAAVITTVLIHSQIGIAGRYDSQAAAVLASQKPGGPVAQAHVQRQAG